MEGFDRCFGHRRIAHPLIHEPTTKSIGAGKMLEVSSQNRL
jgi:hypothetical protein